MSAPSRSDTPASDRLVQRALLLTSQVLGRVIDEGEQLSPGGVHSVRVAIKRLRAGWRLLARWLPLQAAEGEARLRTLHHELAGDRARYVRMATLERLRAAAGDDGERAAFDDALGALPEAAEMLAGRVVAELVGRTFRAESRAWRELGVAAAEADLVHALRRSYRAVRKAAAAAKRDDLATYHRWRLRLKRLLHQLDLLGLGEEAGALESARLQAWTELADLLGRLQDLDDLRVDVGLLAIDAASAERVRGRIAAEQRRLLRRARRRHGGDFAQRPRAFAAAVAAHLPPAPEQCAGAGGHASAA